MLYDDDFLYAAFHCVDSDAWGALPNRNDPLWLEEVVEVFLDPARRRRCYVEIEVSPLNVIFEAYILNDPRCPPLQGLTQWTCRGLRDGRPRRARDDAARPRDRSSGTARWRSRSTRLPDAPHVPPKPGDRWRANLYRIDRAPAAGRVFRLVAGRRANFHSRRSSASCSSWRPANANCCGLMGPVFRGLELVLHPTNLDSRFRGNDDGGRKTALTFRNAAAPRRRSLPFPRKRESIPKPSPTHYPTSTFITTFFTGFGSWTATSGMWPSCGQKMTNVPAGTVKKSPLPVSFRRSFSASYSVVGLERPEVRAAHPLRALEDVLHVNVPPVRLPERGLLRLGLQVQDEREHVLAVHRMPARRERWRSRSSEGSRAPAPSAG